MVILILKMNDVYINGITVNGNLKVKGILYMVHDLKSCPSELLETNNKDVVYNEIQYLRVTYIFYLKVHVNNIWINYFR